MIAAANDDERAGSAWGSPDLLEAYVENRLGPAERREVEGFLACNPDLAAKVMTALHMRGAPQARKRRRKAPLIGLAAFAATVAAAFAVAVFWTPEFVGEAVEAHQTSLMRVRMKSQPEAPAIDMAEVRREARLELPNLPPGWRVMDAQLYPSDDGPALSLLVDVGKRDQLSLFAVRAASPATSKPSMAHTRAGYVAYWERGAFSYVLLGAVSPEALRKDADALAQAPNML